MSEVTRFNPDAFCVVHCRPNSDVVQVTSNLANERTAAMYADGIRRDGGHVFKVLPAGVLVAALEFVKRDYTSGEATTAPDPSGVPQTPPPISNQPPALEAGPQTLIGRPGF